MDTSYPASLQRDDKRRGRQDGERRIPSLAEVRRQQEVLRATGGQLTVGYQVVLLTELNGRLNALHPQRQSTSREAARQIRQHDDRVEEAQEELRRAQQRLDAAAAPLTPEELLPRNPAEARWEPAMLRNRREVARARRIGRAQEALDLARDHLRQRHAERTAAVRRRNEAQAALAASARRLVELYQQRIARYLDALAGSHPDGKTLYPLLSLAEIPLPDWVPGPLQPTSCAAGPTSRPEDRSAM